MRRKKKIVDEVRAKIETMKAECAITAGSALPSDLTILSKFMETPIGGHLPNLRFSPLMEARPWIVFTTPGIQLCAASLEVLIAEMRRLLAITKESA